MFLAFLIGIVTILPQKTVFGKNIDRRDEIQNLPVILERETSKSDFGRPLNGFVTGMGYFKIFVIWWLAKPLNYFY